MKRHLVDLVLLQAIWEDKLERLRRKARDAGFDSYGLDQLDMELEHHRRKMDEYHQLRNEIDEMASAYCACRTAP